MSKKNFVKDLANGKKGEKIFVDTLEKCGIICERNESKKKNILSKYDITSLGKTFEIKFDLYEAKSGNVAIEYYNPKSSKSSGINETTSDFWVFVLTDKSIWLTKSSILKEYIQDFKSSKGFIKNVLNCGDGNSCALIYNRNILFQELFTRIDTLNKDELINVLNREYK